MSTKLSERIRADVEAAPWVVAEVEKLEVINASLMVDNNYLRDELRQAREELKEVP